MKSLNAAIITLALAAAAPVFAQSGAMHGMGMQGMGMDKAPAKGGQATVHEATGVVKSVDAAAGKVTLAHGPVKTLNWPAMTMTFGVKDKRLLDKLGAGQHVHVGFVKQGAAYVVTSVQ
ncbi:copper-binding protein [Massilia rhizosphaerae]|uniref:copper-binding protein n=1 Tax=Massilia rhizosphaerae TaxID=2784389 RepID=UPI0018DBD55B|nr:copper-binding protein [Massilia rhizosphaerae]